jgi:hypothetical protein
MNTNSSEMETPKFSESISMLSDHVKEYINLQADLLKLILVEKLSRLTSLLLLFILFLILLIFAAGFVCLAFVLWYGENIGAMWAGALIVVGVILVKCILLYVFRKKLLLNPIITHLSKIIMEDPDHEREQ